MGDEGYWVHRVGDQTRLLVTDADGRKVAIDLQTADARKLFRHGVLATTDAKTVGGHLLLRWRKRRAALAR